MPFQHSLENQASLPSQHPCYLSQSSSESSLSDTIATVSPGCITAEMTPDEIEIFSTYSGSQHGSSLSIESQAIASHNSSAADFAKARQFYSEADILSEDSHQKRAPRRNSLPPEDNGTVKVSNKKKHAIKLFKSLLPKFLRVRNEEEIATAEHQDEKKHESHFPILDLSKEPVLKTEGKCAYFYYGSVECKTPVQTNSSHSTSAHSPIPTCDAQFECDCDPTENLEQQSSCTDTTSAYCSRSDLESGLGSNFSVTNTISIDSLHNHCGKSVQRSQSVKYHCSIPHSGLCNLQRRERLSQMKLPHHRLSLHSNERVDSPGSSGYCESQSGCSSLYSLGSSICNTPLTGALLRHCHCEYHSSPFKKSSNCCGV